MFSNYTLFKSHYTAAVPVHSSTCQGSTEATQNTNRQRSKLAEGSQEGERVVKETKK
jgi:hypothetical protein